MRKFYCIFLCVTLLLIGHAQGQTKQVKGVVLDSLGMPLPGASVLVRNSSVGTRTDDRGAFVIQVPQNNPHLVISAVGFDQSSVDVTNQDDVRVAMIGTKKAMQEVVVTALGISRDKRSLGYATQTVKGSEIANKGELNVVNGLQGRLAGVNITGASGSVGSSTNINIRGIHSFTQNNQPLFVVD